MKQEKFIERAKKLNGDKYDYSLVEYKNTNIKVKIICNTCGNIFLQTPHNHLRGYNCFCFSKRKQKELRLKTKEQFIEDAKLVHGDKYDYSLIDYVDRETPVKIICNTCSNIFFQRPSNHINQKQGCPYCGKKKSSKSRTSIKEDFIEKAKLIHGDKYDYSQVEYKNVRTKVKIICPIHGMFLQTPNDHLDSCGCPICKESKGEKSIRVYLEENKIDYFPQKTFPDLIDINSLSYDFYLPKYNLLIEFNGRQHYEWVKQFQPTNHDFHRQLHHDWLKRKYAKKNGITLLVVSYKESLNSLFTKLKKYI